MAPKKGASMLLILSQKVYWLKQQKYGLTDDEDDDFQERELTTMKSKTVALK